MPDEPSLPEKPKTTFIYALTDPRPGDLHVYIGKSDNPRRRFSSHLCSATLIKQKSHKSSWILSLAKLQLKPVLQVLKEIPVLEWEKWETEFIRWYRVLGWRIVNSTDGGEGPSNPTAETRAKMRSAKLGKTQPQDVVAKRAAAMKGHKVSTETRAKISSAKSGCKNYWFGKKRPADAIAKMVMSNTGRKRTPESCARISAAITGRRLSDETKAKMSAAKLGHKAPQAARENMSAAQEKRRELENASGGNPRRGTTHSNETRAKISAALVGRVASPQMRAKLRAANLGKKHSNQTRAKLSAIVSEWWIAKRLISKAVKPLSQ